MPVTDEPICYYMAENDSVGKREYAESLPIPTVFDACFQTQNRSEIQTVFLTADFRHSAERKFQISFISGSNVFKIMVGKTGMIEITENKEFAGACKQSEKLSIYRKKMMRNTRCSRCIATSPSCLQYLDHWSKFR